MTIRKTHMFAILALVTLLAVGCTQAPASPQTPASVSPDTPIPTSTSVPIPTSTPVPIQTPAPTPTPAPTAEPTKPADPMPTPFLEPTATAAPIEYEGLPLPIDRGEFFAASGACAICHDRLTDSTGADVSIGSHWRSTMMANAARDPYFQAAVRIEVLAHPALQAVIEDKCARCHTPLAQVTALTREDETRFLDDGFTNAENELHSLAMDAVSCTLCHQVLPDGLGETTSFSGGYAIDIKTPTGERLLFGQYPTDEAQARMMQVASGYLPVEASHLSDSALCATCHTLYTPSIDSAGQIVGEFPEQTPYLEWLHSDYKDTQSCQGCHMPVAEGEAKISITGGAAQSPFSKHTFVGGNAYMLDVLKRSGLEHAVTASSALFDATIGRTVDQLQNRTATVDITEVEIAGTTLSAHVAVNSQVGHKFPTGFPSRRAWLHFAVYDADEQIVFESGAITPDGAIVGNDNDESLAAYEPHYHEISETDQVQIYESILLDSEGNVTTVLLRGYGYAKDNRLLPAGFDKTTAHADIAPYGATASDNDFDGGEDRVQYRVDLGNAKGPFTVEVELLYQSIGYRWAENTRMYQSEETTRFLEYYQEAPNLPVIVSSATADIDPER